MLRGGQIESLFSEAALYRPPVKIWEGEHRVLKFIAKRILVIIPTILLVVTVVFFAFQIIPGDPARLYVGVMADLETVERVRTEMGLDRPIMVQYTDYIWKLLHGNMGTSLMTSQPVIDVIRPRFIETAKLAVVSIIISIVFGLAFGLISAIYKGKFGETFISILTILGISVPVFWLAFLLMYVFGIKLKLLPLAGNDTWKHYFLPAICLAVYNIALISRMTRSSVLEVLYLDYIRTARAKGIKEHALFLKHVMKNALIPIVTVIGLRFGYLFGGAVITENVFAWPGVGRLLVTSVNQRDIPVVQGCLLIFATTFVLINLIVDLLYGVIDPRVRVGEQ